MKIDVPVEPRAIPIAPSKERWREMTKQEQEAFIVSVNEAHSFNRRAQFKEDRRVLDIIDASVCIYEGNAELYDSAHLIKRLEGMVESLERKKEIAEKEAETNRQTIRDMIINILTGRGVTCSASTLEALGACTDADLLKMWVNSALTAKTEAEVFGEQQ